MVTKAELEEMHGNGYLLHSTKTGATGKPLRIRLNGKLKTWVKSPDDFQQPVKYGLYDYFYITPENADSWRVESEY